MIHVIKASRLTKAELIALVYPREDWGHLKDIPAVLWKTYHAPTHVLDTRTNEIVNLINRGIELNKIFITKTQ